MYLNGGDKYGNDRIDIELTKDGTYPIVIEVEEIEIDTTMVSFTIKDHEGNLSNDVQYISLQSTNMLQRTGGLHGSYNDYERTRDGVYRIKMSPWLMII